jgi:integrase
MGSSVFFIAFPYQSIVSDSSSKARCFFACGGPRTSDRRKTSIWKAHTGSALSEPFTSHDLRRTVATRLGESLGVGGEQLIKKVLGHSDGSVTAIYNRYGYVKEMRAGLEAWAREMTKV